MDVLTFRLYGPMASWGTVAVGERRPDDGRPSKSAVLGLVAAALGIRRRDASELAELHACYRMACRLDSAGTLLTDYHTAQWPEAWKRKTWRDIRKEKAKRRAWSRARELDVPRHTLTATQSWRDYRQDVQAIVALWVDGQVSISLADITQALRRPVFGLSLGRRSCPLGLPLVPEVAEVDNPLLALANRRPSDAESQLLADLGMDKAVDGTTQVVWEGDPSWGRVVETRLRRDQPRDRIRWQFIAREEHAGLLEEDGRVP